MKFQNYLNEEKDIPDDKFFSNLLKDCKPFLKDFIKNEGKIKLYSGRKNLKSNFTKKSIRKDRKPLDTINFLDDEINKKFTKKFGIPVRKQGLFVFTNSYSPIDFGLPYIVFPIGSDYSFYQNTNIDDFTNITFNEIEDYILDVVFENSMYINMKDIRRIIEMSYKKVVIFYDVNTNEMYDEKKDESNVMINC
jgi:hypothetical protein